MSRGAGREGESFCYVTTRGRRSGRPHTIEIWFGRTGTSLYLLSGGGERSDWVKNLRVDPSVMVRVGDQDQRPARARVVETRRRRSSPGGCSPRSTRAGTKAGR